ncbi:MAG: exodeoxyribonuclease VII small subunit [Gammaproteobacteria bacterium]|nr:exodeoxyribonuclease VII small subunit [Gammaproteobacteria bacterium]
MTKKKLTIPKSTRFEDALEELETVVRTLEAGEQSLDESLEDFERGIALARFCQQSLSNADRKVQILLQDKGEMTLSNLDNPET